MSAQERLKGDVVGPWGLAALVVGVTSPAIGLYACWGPIEAAAGPIAPLVFLAALAITLPTVLSYASLNRHAPSAGAAATWLWTTVNPTTGLLAGLVTISYFTMGALTTPLLFGLFFRDLLAWAGTPLPGMAAVAVGIVLQSAIVAWISLRGAEASIGTTIRLMLIETGVVLALSGTILWVKAGQPGAIHLGPFDPARAATAWAASGRRCCWACLRSRVSTWWRRRLRRPGRPESTYRGCWCWRSSASPSSGRPTPGS